MLSIVKFETKVSMKRPEISDENEAVGSKNTHGIFWATLYSIADAAESC